MKALRYHGTQDVRIDEIPEPELRPGTVKIKLAWNGICGSDLHLFFEGPIPPMPGPGQVHPLTHEGLPVVFGHEFSGTVVEVGTGVDGLAVGDNVAVEPMIVDDSCEACKQGEYNCCAQMGFIGISGGGGGLGEYIVVESRWAHPVGDIPLDQAAMIEPLSVSYHAVKYAGVKQGDTVLIGGAGPIGLFAAAVASAFGATVIISELSAARRQKALDTGVADHVLDPAYDDAVAKVMELTGGKGVDVAIDAAGVQAVLDTLCKALKVRGTLQLVALYGSAPVYDINTILFKELRIQGSIGYAHDHAPAIKLVQEGKVNLAPLITGKIDARDIVAKGYEELRDHADRQVKILVHL
ncbi:2,3-butanediol dehydrogenase [Bifidobacterium psychraerophilum]|jgi:(R,R)-butanediol dehydrogenase/meso-butanediol dehydrogenase/diacetyl reductase|uniref:2,3-butanediol dehydrogenase n=1 Tax=Bifidobacterium psychraerophilum TaxID=218140 RepID=UPI0039EBEE6D